MPGTSAALIRSWHWRMNKDAAELPSRKSTRLSAYDYGQPGAYFVTICTAGRRNTLASIRRGDPCGRPLVQLTELGSAAKKAFELVEELYGVKFDIWTIMPNHIHFVVNLPGQRATTRVAPTLGRIVGAYKSIVYQRWRQLCGERGYTAAKIWQRNYYEHVVRNDQDLEEIRKYIDENPAKWTEDELFCE